MEKSIHVIYEGINDFKGMTFSRRWEWIEEKGIYELRGQSGSAKQCSSSNKVKVTDDLGSKKYYWCREWQKLDQKDQDLIWLVYGKDRLRQDFIEKIETLKSVSKLHGQALRVFFLLGWNKPCTRCGGSGHYSYCQRFGTRCFKCDGHKLQVTTPTKREIASLLKKYPEGIVNHEDYEKGLIKGKGEFKKKSKEEAAAK